MNELYMLVILYGAFSGASSTGTVLGPNQLTKTGPMDIATCVAAANALVSASPTMLHASCEQNQQMVIYSR